MPQPPAADDATVQAMAQAMRSGRPTRLLLGGRALREPGLLAAARIAAHSGVKLLAETFPTRLERGAGLPAVERIAYLAELAGVQLKDLTTWSWWMPRRPCPSLPIPARRATWCPTAAPCTPWPPRAGRRGQPEKLVRALGAAQVVPALPRPAARPPAWPQAHRPRPARPWATCCPPTPS
jgi:acetolactate synthase-1/2/3 large subunit